VSERPKRQYTLKNPPSAEVRRERAKAGARAANSVDSYVRRIVAAASELTPEHMDQLRTLLTPAGGATE
jgi:hypothetical protein